MEIKACRKQEYATEREALDFRHIIKESHGKMKSLRAYKCPYGDHWHLTSQKQYGNH